MRNGEFCRNCGEEHDEGHCLCCESCEKDVPVDCGCSECRPEHPDDCDCSECDFRPGFIEEGHQEGYHDACGPECSERREQRSKLRDIPNEEIPF